MLIDIYYVLIYGIINIVNKLIKNEISSNFQNDKSIIGTYSTRKRARNKADRKN